MDEPLKPPSMKKRYIHLLLALSLIIIHNSVAQTTYYVDQNHTNSSNSNPGTEELPFQTITRAIQTSSDGDVILIGGGHTVSSFLTSKMG